MNHLLNRLFNSNNQLAIASLLNSHKYPSLDLSKAFDTDLFDTLIKNSKISRSINNDLLDNIAQLKSLILNPGVSQGKIDKKTKIINAIKIKNSRLIDDTLPLINKFHNDLHTLFKLLFIVKNNNMGGLVYDQIDDVRKSFTELLNTLPVFNNSVLSDLKNFNALRNVITHNSKSDVIFKPDDWKSIADAVYNIRYFVHDLINDYFVQLNTVINSTKTHSDSECPITELNKWYRNQSRNLV